MCVNVEIQLRKQTNSVLSPSIHPDGVLLKGGSMKTIWKYNLDYRTTIIEDIPTDAKILKVDMQRGRLCLWALVDQDNERESRRFVMIETGKGVPDWDLNYIGTVHVLADYVLHVFEDRRNINATAGSLSAG